MANTRASKACLSTTSAARQWTRRWPNSKKSAPASRTSSADGCVPGIGQRGGFGRLFVLVFAIGRWPSMEVVRIDKPIFCALAENENSKQDARSSSRFDQEWETGIGYFRHA